MEQDESIYDIIESRKKIKKQIIRYPNRLDVKFIGLNMVQKPYATMGRAEYPSPDPSKYLRKNANRNTNLNSKQVNNNNFQRHCTKSMKMPSLPQKTAKVSHNNTTNFIKRNILLAKEGSRQKCDQKLVITRYGDTVNGAKLEPRHIYSKQFGNVPNYISRVSQVLERQKQTQIDNKIIKTVPLCRYVTRPERDRLLNGLKENWEEQQKKYQLLPMITDSIPRQNAKIFAEKGLKIIEKDILCVEKHPYIYVLN